MRRESFWRDWSALEQAFHAKRTSMVAGMRTESESLKGKDGRKRRSVAINLGAEQERSTRGIKSFWRSSALCSAANIYRFPTVAEAETTDAQSLAQSLTYGTTRLAKLCFHVCRDLLSEFLARISFESFSGLIWNSCQHRLSQN